MSDINEITKSLIGSYLKEKGLEKVDFSLEFPSQNSLGTVSTNVAFNKDFGVGTPIEKGNQFKNWVEQNELFKQNFTEVKVAGPGFINFFANNEYFAKTLNEIVQKGDEFGKVDNQTPRKFIVEFGDPNPFKEIHIGHLRNFCIGESYSKLLETQGHTVIRANYQGDVGLHVAKAMWGLLKREEEFLDSGKSEDEKVKLLSESYVEGATEFETNEEAKQAIIDINKKIYSDDESLHQLWEEGRKVSLEHFEELYRRIGIHFDKYYYESVTAKKGKEVVLSHVDDGVFELDEGAIIYRGEKDGLHTRVFLTSADYATYEGKDLALAILKNEDEKCDESVILTGNEQLEYFQVMIAALKRIAPELAERTRHYTFGHVRLKEGKMSSRTGDVITASWLLDEAVSKVRSAFPEMSADTAEKVGVGAVKYSMLRFSIPSDIHFSFEESISLEGNSGPYLQYSYVRTQSVLEKAGLANPENTESLDNLQIEESELLRFLSQYLYHLEIAAKEFAPNLLCNYLFELSQKFNLFYQKHKIIGGENEKFRLQLTKAVGEVLKNGLQVLGIETVEKM